MKSHCRTLLPALLFASLATPAAAAAAAPDTEAVEFYNRHLDHFFVTANAAEARGIDAGAAGPGWLRTGRSFPVWTQRDAAPADAMPVCRFYSIDANSHFYTASAGECASLKAQEALERNAGKGVRGWAYEGTAFYVQMPRANGACAAGTVALERVYNDGFASGAGSNHRFVDDPALGASMVDRGWIAEATVMCAQAKAGGGAANLAPTATDFEALVGTWEGEGRWKSQNRGRETRTTEALSLAVDAEGAISGTGFGCAFTGTVVQGDGFRSLYKATMEASGCTVESFSGRYLFTHLERFDDGVVRVLMKRSAGPVQAMIDAMLTLGDDVPPPVEPGFAAVAGDWVGTVAWNATQDVAGTITTVAVNQPLELQVSETGAISGTGFGCTFTGSLSEGDVPDDGRFTGGLTASGCTEPLFNGPYGRVHVNVDAAAGLDIDFGFVTEGEGTRLEVQVAGTLLEATP